MTEHGKTPYELREEEALLKYLSESGIDPKTGVPEDLLDRFNNGTRAQAVCGFF